RVVGGRLENLVLARGEALRLLGELLTGHFDDLDALAAKVLLDLGEEVLDLLRREVLDRKALEQVLGGDEAAFAALGCDRLLGFLEPEIDGRFRQSVSLVSGLAPNGRQCTKRSGRVTGTSRMGVTAARPAPERAAGRPPASRARRTSRRTADPPLDSSAASPSSMSRFAVRSRIPATDRTPARRRTRWVRRRWTRSPARAAARR